MAKTPRHEGTNTSAPAGESEKLAARVAALEAENASLKEERAQQHNIVMDLHAQLQAVRAPSPAEKVITARNVRKYGE